MKFKRQTTYLKKNKYYSQHNFIYNFRTSQIDDVIMTIHTNKIDINKIYACTQTRCGMLLFRVHIYTICIYDIRPENDSFFNTN